MAKRHESSWEKLSNVSLVIHAFIGLLAHGTYSRAIMDSWESGALCSSILLSLLQTFDANICIFQTILQEISSVISEAHKNLTQPSRKSPRSRLNAWRVVRASYTRGSETRHPRAFLSMTPDFLRHFPSMSLKTHITTKRVYIQSSWKISWIKQNSLIKEFLFLSPFFTDIEATVLFVESAARHKTSLTIKTQTVTRFNFFHFTLSPSFSEEYILKEKLNVARSPLRGLRAYLWTVLKVCARLHVSATCLSSLLDLTCDYFHDFFAFNNEDGHGIIQINFVKEQNRKK